MPRILEILNLSLVKMPPVRLSTHQPGGLTLWIPARNLLTPWTWISSETFWIPSACTHTHPLEGPAWNPPDPAKADLPIALTCLLPLSESSSDKISSIVQCINCPHSATSIKLFKSYLPVSICCLGSNFPPCDRSLPVIREFFLSTVAHCLHACSR